MNTEEQLHITILVGAVFFSGLVLYALSPHIFKTPLQVRVSAAAFCADLTPRITLEGQAAYAEEVGTKRTLYEKNGIVQMPLASLTKLMTALVAADVLKRNETVTISKAALAPEGDSGFQEGEKWDVGTLIDFTLLTSANDGAHALALATEEKTGETPEAFVKRMNAKASSLNLMQTFFIDDTGLDISAKNAGAYGSAKDVANLLAYIAENNPRLIEGTRVGQKTFTSESGVSHKGTNTSMLITTLGGAIGAKTGFTDLAGGNLAVLYEPLPGHVVALVILGSSKEGRDADMKILAEAVKKSLRRAILCETSKSL